MVKKCIVCRDEAEYRIKDTSDFYCEECAGENFADMGMLLTLEEEAQQLKIALAARLQAELEKQQNELHNS
jgi:tRNA U54 and U55 pseudouridine synthase Pus10